jgi:kinetochor protein Mis14/NSL1
VGAWKEELRRSTGDGDGDGGKVDGGREGTPEALREVRLGALGVAELERQVDVERTWGQGVEGLVRLKSELPGTVARMEKAKRAGGYVLAER